jgi:hypothetical protein
VDVRPLLKLLLVCWVEERKLVWYEMKQSQGDHYDVTKPEAYRRGEQHSELVQYERAISTYNWDNEECCQLFRGSCT